MHRRDFLALSLAPVSTRPHRAVIIGHTGQGNYGHDWDTAFNGFPNIEVRAVADPVESGRAKAMARSGAPRGYAGYREMIARENPTLVVIAPRALPERLPMFRAAAEAGAHILMEKPFAPGLRDADAMVALAEKRRIKVQVGHTARPTPVTMKARRMIQDGEIGTLLEMRARGKEDRRAGGEDMMVLGTHLFDMLRFFAGDPVWCSAHVTARGRGITRADAREATEPLGPVAGDEISAAYWFDSGVHGYFASRPNEATTGDRFGLMLLGGKGAIFVPTTQVPGAPPDILRSRSWTTGAWAKIPVTPEEDIRERGAANRLMVRDLLDAIETGREPVCNHRDGRWTIEMTMAVYQSHFAAGARVPFPLKDRAHPLA